MEQDQVELHPRKTEGAEAKLQEDDGPTLVRELWLVSSGMVSRAGLSGTVPEADGGGSGQAWMECVHSRHQA